VDDLLSIPLQMKEMQHGKHSVEKTNVDVVNESELKDFPIYDFLRFQMITLIMYPMRYPICNPLKLKA